MSIQYYDTKTGVWLGSYQEGTPCEIPVAAEVPPEAQGGGGEGTRWDGTAWVAYVPPPERCTRFEGLRALGRIRVQQIEAMMAALDTLEIYPGVTLSEDEVWSIRTAWGEAGSFERLSPDLTFVMWLFGWDDDMRDSFFRWIGDGNLGPFP